MPIKTKIFKVDEVFDSIPPQQYLESHHQQLALMDNITRTINHSLNTTAQQSPKIEHKMSDYDLSNRVRSKQQHNIKRNMYVAGSQQQLPKKMHGQFKVVEMLSAQFPEHH